MFKKALMLVSGNAFASALSLVRNLAIARLVSPEDYGIASTFAISMSIVEMMSYLGLQQLMIVDKDGDVPHVQAAAQGFQVLRGCLSSTILFLISGLYAAFLGIEQVAWAFQIIALVPFFNGFQHFDQHRLKRHMNFRPSVLTSALPPLFSVLSVWPAYLLWPDFRVMLVSIFTQALSMVLVSHLTAERRYQLAWDRWLVRRAIEFGWPLLLNGVLLFAIFNGDRLIIGRELGMTTLAIFSMGFTLTLTPTLVLANSMQTFFVPMLSREVDNRPAFQTLSEAAIEGGVVIGLLLILGTSLLGGPIVHILLGSKYEGLLPFLVQLGIMQGLRVAKSGPSLIALSRGRNGLSIWANIPRILTLPVAWVVVLRTGNIESVIGVGIAAEGLGLMIALWTTRTRLGVHLRHLVLPMALFFGFAAVSWWDAWVTAPRPLFADHLHPGLLLVLFVGLATILSMSALRKVTLRRLRRG